VVPEEAVLFPVAVAGGVEELNWWVYLREGVKGVVGVEGRDREERGLGVEAMVADLDLHM
jgi:hypothetical protein